MWLDLKAKLSVLLTCEASNSPNIDKQKRGVYPYSESVRDSIN